MSDHAFLALYRRDGAEQRNGFATLSDAYRFLEVGERIGRNLVPTAIVREDGSPVLSRAQFDQMKSLSVSDRNARLCEIEGRLAPRVAV